MINSNTAFICICLISMNTLLACAQPKNTTGIVSTASPIAFPNAEGYGKYTTGGRGGKVFIITNLNDDGEGSLRKALNAKGAKMIVFAVSGTIHLLSPLNIKANTTIAGQTAPGDGICIADHPVKLGGDNIVVRYLRFRMGDRYQNKGMVNGAGHDDAFSGYNKNNIIIDHCSMSWSTDEVCSIYGGDSVTLQWNIISEPLNYSYHFETGDKDFENHGYGGIWGGKNLSAHHNLFAHCISRNPRLNGTRNYPEELVDYRNNIIYNWGHNNIYGGEGGNYNIVNNYYKYGPSTAKKTRFRIVNPSKLESPFIPYGKYYVAGNHVDGSPEISQNNSLGVHMGDGSAEDKKTALVNTVFGKADIPFQTAQDSYIAVLQHAGASLPRRDTLDERIIENVRNRTGKIIDVQGGYPHGTEYSLTINAWPVLHSLPAPRDTDADGMPDDWEITNGLDPNAAADASQYKLHTQYTNIEIYINSLVK